MKKRGEKCLYYAIIFILALQTLSAAHYMVGVVNDALDGTSANGYEVVLWNPANGIDDNLTDIIGPSGNSGANNTYMIDCELLNTPCTIGDEIRVKVLNNGSDYITDYVNATVTGAGFDIMPNLTLNSPPNVTLDFPVNYANLSSSETNFSCTANDLDGNLANVTLYGNWSGGWHANETKQASGDSSNVNFTKILTEGIYTWGCLATDSLGISKFSTENFTLTIDLTPPTISSVEFNATKDVCEDTSYVRVNCTTSDALTSIDSVIIESIAPNKSRTNYTAQLLTGNTYYTDIPLNDVGIWSFNCISNDSAGNTVNKTSTEMEVHSNLPDLTINYSDIVFSNTDPLENEGVIIYATINNNGCSDANNFLVGFFENDPDLPGSIQINGNKTLSVSNLSNATANVTWNAKIGFTNIFVYADINNAISEYNESNNKNNNTITVGAWQEFYGNVSIDKILSDEGKRNLTAWFNESSISGNIFIADTESNVDWLSLQAIGRNTTDGKTSNDFSEIDALLNMTSFNDSVSNIFTTDGNTPIATDSFFIYKNTIYNVPIINSTNNTNFITGILWDTSDDASSDGEYSQADKEDLVFVSKVNKNAQGKYGIYDYEMRIPVRLREYYTTDSSDVYIYFDLN